VLAAITGVVGGAISAAKKLLHISSPSRVFAEMGEQTGAGFSAGVDKSAGDAQDAMANMVAPPDVSGAGGKGGGKSIDLSGSTFVFHGVKDAEDAQRSFAEFFTRVIEGDVTQLGGAT